ncbi:hypothetical protein [Streptomyces sp. NPDC002564]|uniref:hypothetical protein n=1 Tax=Streptomyces sp. NPDC002564 TaxID=3364649 RepID=UPI0036AFC1C0
MDANSFLMGGGGAPTAKFPTPNTVVGGRITEPPKVEQQRDIKTGEHKTWSNGDPMMQLVVTVQTDERDPAIEDDDGKRRIFIKGVMKNAVADAVRVAGAKGLEVGGSLWVKYTHDGVAKERGMSPPKQYDAKYTAAAAAHLGVGQTPAPTPAAPPGVNPTTGEITTPPPGLTTEQHAAAQHHPATAALAQQAAAQPPSPVAGGEPPF